MTYNKIKVFYISFPKQNFWEVKRKHQEVPLQNASLQNCFYLEKQTVVLQWPGFFPSRLSQPWSSFSSAAPCTCLIKWQLLCTPVLLQNLTMIWVQDRWESAQELRSFRTSFLSLGDAFLGLEKVSLYFPEEQRKMRLGVWVGMVREDSTSLLCADHTPRNNPLLAASHHGPMDKRASEALHFSLPTSAAGQFGSPTFYSFGKTWEEL